MNNIKPMRLKIPAYCLLSALAFATPDLNAALILNDNMDYGASNQGAGVGDWADGSNRLNYIGGTNLSFGGDADYVNASANAGTGSLQRNDNIDDRFFTRDYSNAALTGEVWISMLLDPTTAGAATGEVVGVSLNGTGGLSVAGDLLGVGYDGTNLRPVWYDLDHPTSKSNYASGNVTSGETVLLVAKFDIGAAADSFSMWLFDSTSPFGQTEASLGGAHLTSTAADFGDELDHIQVGGVQGFRTHFDQIRISNLSGDNGLSEVLTLAAVPEPSAALLGGLGALLLLRRRRN